MASSADMPCPKGWDGAAPERCKGNKEYGRGIREGVFEFQRLLEKKAAALEELAAATETPPSRPVVIVKPSTKPIPRKLTGEECARMERELPAVADALGMRRKSYSELKDEAKANAFPDAALAMLGWLILYNNESLIRHQDHLAKTFGEKCRQGSIRVRD